MTEEAVKEKINFGSSSSNSESAEKVRIQESSNIEDNAQEALSGTGRSIEAGSTDNFENIYVAGTVGIGVASPFEKLEVSGTVKAIAFMGDGFEITALDGKKITSGIIEDSRIPSTISRESRFDPTNGHKHTGAAGDGPIISHSKLDEALPVNPDSIDTATNKHISDALAKGWQDHIMTKSGNPHGTTAIDVGALPNVGGTINGSLQVNGNIGTTGTVDGVDISSFFNVFTGHKHTGAAGDGPKISHNNLDNILAVNTNSQDTISNKHVSDSLAKSWNDHIMTKSGNPHGTTATNVGALPITGGTINGILQVSDKIGIGTDIPGGKLDVRGDIRAGNSDIYFTKVDHNHTGIGNTAGLAAIENAADYGALMILGRAGTPKGRNVRLWDYLQINGSMDITGNVGIGTTNPGERLDVSGTIRLYGKNAFQGGDSYLRINQDNAFPGGTHFNYRANFHRGITTGSWWDVEPGVGNLLVQGNVGIGTPTPQTKLDVQGDIRINDKDLWLRGSTDKNHGIGWYGLGKLFANTNLDGPAVFGCSGGALGTVCNGQKIALKWDYSGNVGVGTTSPEDSFHVGSGIAKLVIGSAVGRDLAYGSSYIGFNAGRTKSGWKFNTDTSNNGGTIIYSTPYGALVFVTVPSNNAVNGDQMLNDSQIFSDRRLIISENGKIEYFGMLTKGSSRDLKENIHDLSIKEAFEALENLNPVKFVMKKDKERRLQVGFIAEEVPDLAATADRKGIINDNIVALLTKVIKEQQKTIETLIDDVKMLKTNKGGIIS